MSCRRMVSAILCATGAAASALAGSVSPASAALADGHVRLFGSISCGTLLPAPLPGPGWLATRARFQAADGEAHDAQIMQVAYSVDFYQVPAAGENITVYVTCGNGEQWGRSFGIGGSPTDQNVNLFWH